MFVLTQLQKGAYAIAIFHCSIKIISRGKGRTAVAAAAYRSGTMIKSEYDGTVNDYTKKTGVVHTEILLPENAPTEYSDRAVLWNAVEMAERYKTAQLAREIEVALPAELSQEQNISLIRRFVKENFVSAGMCADVCVHDKGEGNPHAHVMLTMRPIEKDGHWGAKSKTVDGKKIPTVDWNEQTKAEEWRRAWAAYCNTALRLNGFDAVVDHRSYERQGVEQVPTIHLGPAAAQMEKRGIRTERGDINREIAVTNQELRQLRARLNKLKDWLKEEMENTDPPTLAEVLKGILERQGRSSIANLKDGSKMFTFLEDNQILDMAGLRNKFGEIVKQSGAMGSKISASERRLKTLDEHIRNAEIYQKHSDVHKQYRTEENPKKKAAFAEKHHTELEAFNTAAKYLKEVMNGKPGIPLKAWKEERAKLIAGRSGLNQEYARLKAEVQQVEIFQRQVENLLREEAREQRPIKSKGIEM